MQDFQPEKEDALQSTGFRSTMGISGTKRELLGTSGPKKDLTTGAKKEMVNAKC